jgi:hypothetical protein
MPGPHWKMDDDLKTVTVTFPTEPPVSLTLDVAAIEEMLKFLGIFRAGLAPEIPMWFALGQTVEAIPDPAWITEADAMLGNSLLHIRDPRYGWLHYMIPRAEARKLAGYLQMQVDTPPPGQGLGAGELALPRTRCSA